jgi:hypothetical protein
VDAAAPIDSAVVVVPDGAPDAAPPPPDAPAIDAAAGCGADETPCMAAGDPGRCHDGVCCAGCWNGFACVAGTSEVECGKEGLHCTRCLGTCGCHPSVCLDQGDGYQAFICSFGACEPSFLVCCGPADGAFCDGGALECTAFGCNP